MKKAKTVMSILTMSFAALAVALFVCLPLFEGLAAIISGVKYDIGAKFIENINNVPGRLAALPGAVGGIFTNFGLDAIKNNLPLSINFVVLAVALVLFIILFIMLLVKKHAKGLWLSIPTFLLLVVALLLGSILFVPNTYFISSGTKANNQFYLSFVEMKYLVHSIWLVLACTMVFGLLAEIFYMSMVGKLAKPAKAEEAAPALEAPAPAPEEAVAPAPAAVVAEPANEAVVKEAAPAPAPAPAPAFEQKQVESSEFRVLKRILVHRNGKVVRVLNEHYFDITTNIYVENGLFGDNLPKETEQQHYEKIIQASQLPVAPAPVVAPAPAPAPAPVVAPAPAPAPVVVPAPVQKDKIERIPFAKRLKQSDKALKLAYNELKSEILSYGIKSRISTSGDTFRLHTKTYVKIVVAGKSLKLYFALNPKNYRDSTFPISDAGNKTLHKDTPLVFKVKSDLSIRRAKQLIADCAAKDKLEQGEVVKHDHAREVK